MRILYKIIIVFLIISSISLGFATYGWLSGTSVDFMALWGSIMNKVSNVTLSVFLGLSYFIVILLIIIYLKRMLEGKNEEE